MDLKKAMQTVLNKLDHKNIDKDVEEFKNGVVSTAENISVYIFEALVKNGIEREMIYEVKLKETANNTAIYRGE